MGWKLGISCLLIIFNALDTLANHKWSIALFPLLPGPVGARRRHRHRRILVLLHDSAFAAHPGGGVGQLEAMKI